MHSNRLVMACWAIKQNCSINSQTCFFFNTSRKISPSKIWANVFTSQHIVSSENSWLILVYFYFTMLLSGCFWNNVNNDKNNDTMIKFLIFKINKTRFVWFFSRLNRFETMSSLNFSYISDFCHFIAGYSRLGFNATIRFCNPVLQSLHFTPKPFQSLIFV